ncbi:hypothetical protein BX265_6128 [Streptomyces sp. TLI_235]|nr:helix-turn-helix transcriptional regulator [Streptomyces sp. TLI_235]PBC71518.1 hypothetical protein BX265_6128 [Streptomyces sp. TLI_235]
MRANAPMCKLWNRDLLKLLMQRTGTGSRISTRDLAKAVGCAHGTIGNLLNGAQEYVPLALAQAIAARIGVDLLVLFTPTGRAVPAPRIPDYAEAVPA